MLHEVFEVFHNVKVLVRTSHASHAVDLGQVSTKLVGEGLQGRVLAEVPEVSGLLDELCCIVVETELSEFLVCEGGVEGFPID